MGHATFDALAFVQTLESVGMERAQATAIASGVREEVRERFAVLEGKINLLQWMMGPILGGILALLLKAFFG